MSKTNHLLSPSPNSNDIFPDPCRLSVPIYNLNMGGVCKFALVYTLHLGLIQL